MLFSTFEQATREIGDRWVRMRRMWGSALFFLGWALNFKLINNIRPNIHYQPFATQAGWSPQPVRSPFLRGRLHGTLGGSHLPSQAQRPWLPQRPVPQAQRGFLEAKTKHPGAMVLPKPVASRWLVASPAPGPGRNTLKESLADPRSSFIQQTLSKQLFVQPSF